MSLTFLVPLFLLGIAGIVVPIVVHLTRRQRRNVVHFPSLMFLEKIPFQEQRRRRIQHWFLLSLRALALVLLAAAFARPFFDRSTIGAAGSGGPREVVLLVDQSYSMGIGDLMDRAKSEARQVVDGLGPLDRATVVAFSRGATVVARSTSDRLRLTGSFDSLQVSSGATRYGPALKVAQTVLEESNLPAGEVYLLSDFQRSGWTGDEGVRLPAGSRVVAVPLRTQLVENLLVADVSLPRQVVAGRERVTPTARVVRRGGEEAREVTVALEVDGQQIQTRSVTIQPNSAAPVAFQPFTLSRPHTTATVRLPDDPLVTDNAHHFVVSPGASLPLLIVEGATTQSDVSLYLRGALEISDAGRYAVRSRRATSVRPVDLDDQAAVFVNDVQIDGASAERLRTFVQEGGGLLVAVGQGGGWPSSAADLLPGTIGAVEDRLQGRGGRLGYLDYEHPVFEVFAGPRSGDFTGARFYRARRFSPSDSAAVLARFDDGSVALAERRVGRGRVLVWTSTLDAFWNDLPLQPVFLPWVHRLAEYLGGRAEVAPWFVTGQVVDLADPEALRAAGLVSSEAAGLAEGLDQVAVTPSGATIALPAEAGPRYLPLDEHGFYVVRRPGTDPDRPFTMAVNVDLEESDLTGIDPEELVLQLESATAAAPSGGGLGEALELRREDQERRQSIWRWLLIAAFALFVAETAISNWVSRQSPGAGGSGAG